MAYDAGAVPVLFTRNLAKRFSTSCLIVLANHLTLCYYLPRALVTYIIGMLIRYSTFDIYLAGKLSYTAAVITKSSCKNDRLLFRIQSAVCAKRHNVLLPQRLACFPSFKLFRSFVYTLCCYL